MHEIITLQLGTVANHVGTHFWNMQEFNNNNNSFDFLFVELRPDGCFSERNGEIWRVSIRSLHSLPEQFKPGSSDVALEMNGIVPTRVFQRNKETFPRLVVVDFKGTLFPTDRAISINLGPPAMPTE